VRVVCETLALPERCTRPLVQRDDRPLATAGREEELIRLSLAIRDLVLKGDIEDDELLGLMPEKG